MPAPSTLAVRAPQTVSPAGGYAARVAETVATVNEVLLRLRQSYDVVAVALAGSAAGAAPDVSSDIDLCVMIATTHDDRLRWTVRGHRIDLFVNGVVPLERILAQGSQAHVITMYASAKVVHGDTAVADRLIAIARDRLHGPAPESTPEQRFRYACEPFDLLRTFETARHGDAASAAVVLASLTRCSIEAFFVLNRVWTRGPAKTMDALAAANPQAAAALRGVCEAPLSDHLADPGAVRTMVRTLVGREPVFGDGILRRRPNGA